MSMLTAMPMAACDQGSPRPPTARALNHLRGPPEPRPSRHRHSLTCLAHVLRAQGDLDHARTLLERALAIYKTHFGPDHPTTAACLDNLATVLADQGHLDTARTQVERALHIRQAGLGAMPFA
jgi:predicted RNA binding protein with dsRBD fold (UPF0201 family)